MSTDHEARRWVNVMAMLRPPGWCRSCGYWPPTHDGVHRYDCAISPPPATKPQLARLGILRSTRFDGDRCRWFAWVASNTGRTVDSNKSLTKREAMTLIDAAEAGDET